jgi:hypothetical protein
MELKGQLERLTQLLLSHQPGLMEIIVPFQKGNGTLNRTALGAIA